MERITLATLPDATAQQVFDQVAVHLLTQNKRCESEEDDLGDARCVYRGEDGLRCAAGCLIADEEYDSDRMEGHGWVVMAKTKGIVPTRHCDLIQRLQGVHDSFAPEGWEARLRHIATIHGLNTDAIDNMRVPSCT